MKKDTIKTDVKFLVNTPQSPFKNQNEQENKRDIFAYFPSEIDSKRWDVKDGETIFYLSYSIVGQHSGCCQDYANESRPATQEERKDLIKELEGLGYNLNIIN